MNIPLYRLKDEIVAYMTFPALSNGLGAIIEFADATIIFEFENNRHRQRLFELVADTSKEVGAIYNSMIDGKEYVEWHVDKKSLEGQSVITPQGFIFELDQLPKEEFGYD